MNLMINESLNVYFASYINKAFVYLPISGLLYILHALTHLLFTLKVLVLSADLLSPTDSMFDRYWHFIIIGHYKY